MAFKDLRPFVRRYAAARAARDRLAVQLTAADVELAAADQELRDRLEREFADDMKGGA